jgi:chromosome segregation ATPase
MRDSEELTNIPPIVPSRDDVDSHQQSRKGQSQDIVRSNYYAQIMKVSTWPVRIMLTLLFMALVGVGIGSYYFYGEYEDNLRQAELLMGDLERRFAQLDNSAAGSALEMQESLDFHFSEIDKLWAARNKTNQDVVDVRSEIAKLVLVNTGQDEVTANVSQQIADTGTQINASNTRVSTLTTELDQLNQSVAAMNTEISNLDTLRADMQSIQAALNSGDSNILGLIGRLEYVEESMESVNAHRLQINETLFRLQENLESIQTQLMPAGL